MSVAKGGIRPIFGNASFGSSFASAADVEGVLKVLKDNKVDTIDTAYIYGSGQSETLLGEVGASKGKWGFNIDTKAPGGFKAGTSTRNGVVEQAKESLGRLKMDQVDVYFLHAFDDETPLEDSLAGINEIHKAGHFKRFGVSNFEAEEVQRAYDICKEKGYVLPTVYQGNYNAVSRTIESTLIPTLRKLGMAFHAYSPAAGGILSRSKEQLLEGGENAGRFDVNHPIGFMYNAMYNKPSILEALDIWGEAADAIGASRIELAYRWVTFNSVLKPEHNDAIIFGASKLEQVQSTLDFFKKGPLDDATVKKIEKVWELTAAEAPVHNSDIIRKKR